jgi:NADH-quinone oxidoreductase subunit H
MTFQFTQWHFWITLVLIACAFAVIQGTCAYLTFMERKISAWVQDRIGPNRAGRELGVPFGLLQPIADGLKFLFKEQVIPSNVDKVFYLLGPMVAVSTSLLAFAVVPFGRTMTPPVLMDRRTDEMVKASATPLDDAGRQKLEDASFVDPPRGPIWPHTATEMEYVLAADEAYAREKGTLSFAEQLERHNEKTQFVIAPHVDVGIVFVFAIGSLAVYAIVLGGWSSNNKYSFMGALRSSAQLISYEIPLGMAVIGVFILAGSLNLEKIVEQQARDGWNVFFQPLACLLFVTSLFAECNRVPFDLPEAEQELVGGYHTEYSGMKFAMFFLGEYTHMITTSLVMVVVFFGGWSIPFVPRPENPWADGILCLVVIAVKTTLFIGLYLFIRWTIPRFRFDQLMALAWKVMMPLALINLVAVLVLKYYHPLTIDGRDYSYWLMLPVSLAVLIGAAALSLRLPKAPQRAKVIVRGHPVTGGNEVIVG